MVKKLNKSAAVNGILTNSKTPKAVGRPPFAAPTRTSISVSLTTLRKVLRAMQSVKNQLRPGDDTEEFNAALNGLLTRLGQGAAEGYVPAKAKAGRPRKGYEIVNAAGISSQVQGAAAAAAAVGISPASLAVMLARGGGTYRAKRGDSFVTVRKLA